MPDYLPALALPRTLEHGQLGLQGTLPFGGQGPQPPTNQV